ncbi:MAG: orotate phosphoribosyltransferase [Verrucomicrobiales bacterium]|nr:orotate phosphoribosyltransferase [Verrucomicrobiales bacterium]MBP9223710.1 orotate phosphoribosyltransferase [Verrucomicrobiales bacterium]HQZ28487.1 orotate phosphoribosyltransferase [Verrucomicrobiales bacterium]
MPTSPEETIELLKEYGAVEQGHFILASGKHSAYYVKKGKLVQHPWELQQMIEQCLPAMAELGRIDVVLSPAMGGVPVGQQVGLAVHARTIYAERNSESNELELKRGFEIKSGERLLLVEDVITTGGTLLELTDFIESQGGEVAGVFVVVNRSGKTKVGEYPVVSCMEIQFPVYEADSVPESLAAIPAVRPGTKKVE